MTEPSLDAVLMKINRAAQHMNELEALFAEFFESKPYRVSGEFESDGPSSGWQVINIEVVHEPDPRWGVLVGDVVHNLSSALDHLMWQLTLWNDNRPTRRSAFPAVECRVHIRDPKGPWPKVLNGIHPKHRAIVESVQPYQRWHGARFHPLAVIRRLWNIDKHRDIHAAFAWWGEPEEGTRTLVTYEGTIDDEVNHVLPRREIEGVELFRLHLTELQRMPPYVKVESNFPIDIAFGTAKWAVRADTLSDLGAYVGHLYQLFEPDFRSTGASG